MMSRSGISAWVIIMPLGHVFRTRSDCSFEPRTLNTLVRGATPVMTLGGLWTTAWDVILASGTGFIASSCHDSGFKLLRYLISRHSAYSVGQLHGKFA